MDTGRRRRVRLGHVRHHAVVNIQDQIFQGHLRKATDITSSRKMKSALQRLMTETAGATSPRSWRCYDPSGRSCTMFASSSCEVRLQKNSSLDRGCTREEGLIQPRYSQPFGVPNFNCDGKRYHVMSLDTVASNTVAVRRRRVSPITTGRSLPCFLFNAVSLAPAIQETTQP